MLSILFPVHFARHGYNEKIGRPLVHALSLDFTFFESEFPHIIAVVVVLALTLELSFDVWAGCRELLKLFLDCEIKLKHDLFLQF